MNIYRNIDRSSLQFDFVVHTKQKGAFDDEIYAMGGRIFSVPRYQVYNHLAYKKAWRRLFKDHGREWKFVHGHVFTTASIYLRIAKQFGLSTVAHSHSTSSGSGLNALIKDILQRPLKENNIADYRYACSKEAGSWLFGEDLSGVTILKNAVNAHKFAYNQTVRDQVRKDLDIDQFLVMGHVGTFYEPKNHMFLIDVFQEVHLKNSNALLMLVGRGHLEKQVRDKVKDLGLEDRVRFMGVRADVAELLQAMDLFVLPSLFEGLPLTIIEAQAAGLPCFVSDTITDEVRITDLVRFISLQVSAEQWAKMIHASLRSFTRRNTCFDIINSGYDVQSTARSLQDFYLKASPTHIS